MKAKNFKLLDNGKIGTAIGRNSKLGIKMNATIAYFKIGFNRFSSS